MIDLILDPLVSLAFPARCLICGNSVERLADGQACSDCWLRTRIFTGRESGCSKCGLLLPTGRFDLTSLCSTCVDHHYDRAVAAAEYHFAAKAAVISLKSSPNIPKRVKEMFTARFDVSKLCDTTLIVPVPLSPKRRIERGFNQAGVLSELISRHAGIRTGRVLQRTRHFAMHRGGMDRKARARSVKNAFTVRIPKLVKEERILVVDDVYTTGSTASACAAALKASGAAQVNILTLARTAYL